MIKWMVVELTKDSRATFHEELERLKELISEMAEMCQTALRKACDSLVERDPIKAKEVIEGDKVLDQMEHELEEKCMLLLALQQPMAVDLRVIGGTLKLITDLERIGDLAVVMCRASIRLTEVAVLKPLVDIPQMFNIAGDMLGKAILAFRTGDRTSLDGIPEMDDTLDHLYNQIFRELLTYMMEDPQKISQGAQLLFVAKNLERIGDHVTNISEKLIYILTGERVNLNP